MRKQIAAANWKMNLTLDKAETLLDEVLSKNANPTSSGQVVFAVPFPYLLTAAEKLKAEKAIQSQRKTAATKKAAPTPVKFR